MLILAELLRNLKEYNESVKILDNISITRNDGLDAIEEYVGTAMQ